MSTESPGQPGHSDQPANPGQPAGPAQPVGSAQPDQTGQSGQRPRRRRGVGGFIVLAVVLAVVAGFLGGVFGARLFPAKSSTASSLSPTASTDSVCGSVQIADKVLPAIVTISIESDGASGVGSGEIVRDSGYIVTNNHVISPAASGGTIEVRYSSGVSVPAKLVGRDPRSDLAVLKVTSSTPLPTVPFGNSENLQVGQPVVALGSPLGLSGSVTSGIVSALGRTVPVPSDNGTTALLAGAIQTDAAINPGNSGGALVNCSGQLVGVNTAIATVPNESGQAGGGSVGIGFAVPVNLVGSITDQLISTGHASYPYFGVSVSPIPSAVAEKFGVTDGLFVQSVVPGGPMDKAGIMQGDVLLQVDGIPATSADVLTHVTILRKAGDTVPVKYSRDGTDHTANVTLQTAPAPAG
jgi:putative serine protease PepD